MGTKDRKLREKEQLREQILKAAREIFFEKGFQDTSIRNIADRIEYSPGTIYLYFKDKDAIFHELHKEGFQLLRKNKMQVLQHIEDPFERLIAMGKGYLEFARENPDYYDLMFIITNPMEALEDKECWQEGQTAFDILVQVVADCIQQGRFQGHNAENLAYTIWSAMHGMVTINIRGRCMVITEDKRDHITSLGMETLVMLLEKS
ncbi:TetR/AcrR family transcriptional regulator [Catalinimonas niigatensis]|uniref:TetR/AcrR family transcriptional regulator n=1 Tax=Catalinimonas niigatensis TaxID=1397264 RepID=UPI002665C0D1|nr:TetR/AcrR family transcriptional regulator [Catalinimonas niigatensis]WPP50417.1 TetR/AcrR family transcriptional regulator [Catalinimonas niigatensis]